MTGDSRLITAAGLDQVVDQGQILAVGFDTIIESFNAQIPEVLLEELEQHRNAAIALDDSEGRVLVEFGGEKLHVHVKRGRGVLAYLSNDLFAITMRSPKCEYPISVRLSSAALWQYGLDAVRDRVIACLLNEVKPVYDADGEWTRITEGHYAVDVFSPDFTERMVPGIAGDIVAHSSVKRVDNGSLKYDEWVKGNRVETLTIGKHAPLEVQVYDKGREITEASGKTWMYELWERSGWSKPAGETRPDHCWRLEVRMRAEWLRNRGIRTLAEFRDALEQLVCEALVTRRLTDDNGDTNRSRRPVHWLWALAFQSCGMALEMLPLGKRVVEASAAVLDRLRKTIAGTMRTATILSAGEWSIGTLYGQLRSIEKWVTEDPEHDRKCRVAIERYRWRNSPA